MSEEEQKAALEAEKAALEAEQKAAEEAKEQKNQQSLKDLEKDVAELKEAKKKAERETLMVRMENAEIDTKGFEKYNNSQLAAIAEVFGNERGIVELRAKEEPKPVIKRPPRFNNGSGFWEVYDSETNTWKKKQ